MAMGPLDLNGLKELGGLTIAQDPDEAEHEDAAGSDRHRHGRLGVASGRDAQTPW
jgi:hypothetical protein